MAVAWDVISLAKVFARAVTRFARGVEVLEARYDRERDVLYVSFGTPEEADDAELTDEDIVLRYREGRLVGFTVIRASRFGLEADK